MFLVLLFDNTRGTAGATKMILHESPLRDIKNVTFAEQELSFQY
jgi:hypothetical protein